MSDKDSKLLWEAYSEGVEANTPPRDKKNRGDFLPKHVRDEINNKRDDDDGDEEEEEGLEEDARSDMLKAMPAETSGNIPEQPNGWTGEGFEELSLEDLTHELLRYDHVLPSEVKQSEDYQELLYDIKRSLKQYVDELEIKLNGQ